MEFVDSRTSGDWRADLSPAIASLHDQVDGINDYRLWKYRHPVAGYDELVKPSVEHLDTGLWKPSLQKPVEPQRITPLEPPRTTMQFPNLVEDKPDRLPPSNRIDPVQADQANDHQGDLRFWTNELAGGTAAGLSGGPVSKLLSVGAKEHLARAIEADDFDSPVARSVAENSYLLKASQWWEEHFGVADGGKLRDRVAQRQANLDAELSGYKAEEMDELHQKLQQSGPSVAKSLQRLMNDVLTAPERRLLAGYWQLGGKTPGHLNLTDIGVVPEGLEHLLKSPPYAASCRENGVRLLDKLAEHVSPEELRQFEQYHNLVRQVADAKIFAAPELEQYIKDQQELIYRILKIPQVSNFKASVADLEPEAMGKILSNSMQSCEEAPTGFWRNFGRGMIFAGAVQTGEDFIERGLSLGKSGHGNHLGSYARAIGIPLALSSGMTPAAKFGLAIGIGVLGSCADSLLPETNDAPSSSLLRPSPMEQVIVGIAAGIPLRAPGILPRTCLIVGAVAAGKVITSIEQDLKTTH